MKTKKVSKIEQVLDHLKSGHSITSMMAIQLYGATRLSAIIYTLKDRGYDITSVKESQLDRNGRVCNFSRYKLNGVLPISVKEKLNTNPETKYKPQPQKNNESFFKRLLNKLF